MAIRNIRPIGSPVVRAMNWTASAGVHRFASAGFSGSRSVIPAHGFQVIRRAFTAPFSAARRVPKEVYAVTTEPLTPVAVEAKLRQLVNDLARAQVVLLEARDAEVDARHEYDRTRRRALLSDKSPKVTRGGYTVAEQSAWVE